MGNRDLPDIYAQALGPVALRLGHIHQANPSCQLIHIASHLINQPESFIDVGNSLYYDLISDGHVR